MKKKINKLDKKHLKLLKEKYDVLNIPNDCDIVYEKQIPNTGIALIDGEIELMKRSKPLEKVGAGSILGIHHVLHGEPVKMGCKVKKDSKIVLLGRSELLESLEDTESHLHAIVKDYKKKNES